MWHVHDRVRQLHVQDKQRRRAGGLRCRRRRSRPAARALCRVPGGQEQHGVCQLRPHVLLCGVQRASQALPYM